MTRAPITPDQLLRAYAAGIFPMSESRDDSHFFWVDPDQRGILPLEAFHTPRKLRRRLRQAHFAVTCDLAFPEVLAACAEAAPGRMETWINDPIAQLYGALSERGFGHSVEVWREGCLAGGLYGVALGSAFFGESMFSRETDASKIALVHLVAHLRAGGYTLLDTQFVTGHLSRFGAIEIPRADYRRRLEEALKIQARFPPAVSWAAIESVLDEN